MKVLLGIGHPADVHFFRFFIREMQRRGHAVVVAAREKDNVCFLLDQFHIPYHLIAVHQKTLLRKIFDYFIRWARTYRLCKQVRPDVAVGVGDFYLPQIGRLLGFRSIVMTDTEPAAHDYFLTFPFANSILTPMSYRRTLSRKQVRFNSYKELAYLHRSRFSPDPGIYEALGIGRDEKYVIIRFCSRSAVHDLGHKGLSYGMKSRVVDAFSKHARVFISSEEELPRDLKDYQLPVSPEKIHHVIYYADLLYGESATMASEAACLGTPAIYVDNRGRGYTDDQELRFGLVFNFRINGKAVEQSIQKGIKILEKPKDSWQWHDKQDHMLREMADVTDFLICQVIQGKR